MAEFIAKWLWLIVIVLILAYIYFKDKYEIEIKKLQKLVSTYESIISEKEKNIIQYTHLNEAQKLEFQKNVSDIKLKSQEWALSEFEKFKSSEIEALKKRIEENALSAAANLLQKWKIENEAKIRQDAANRSYAVNLGKITEHLVPFHTRFPFNPKDARFIGSPIDLIVFDGLSDEKEDLTIYFVEIKTGKSRLSSRQQMIKSAVEQGKIVWYPINSDEL